MKVSTIVIIGMLLTAGTMVASADIVTHDLVSWWEFEETSGTTAADSVSGNTGTLYNGPTWTNDTTGAPTLGALYFDDDNTNYVNCGNPASLNLVNGFTYEAWVKLENYDIEHIVLSKGSRISLRILATQQLSLFCRIGAANFIATSNETLDTNEWYHVAATYATNDTTRLYINGSEVSYSSHQIPVAGTTVVQSSDPVVVGAWSLSGAVSRPFAGIIDNVRIYSDGLTEAEIEQNFLFTANNPFCWWRFEEMAGTIAKDSGLYYDGKLVGGPVWTNDTAGEKSLGALYFDDDVLTDQAVDCGNSSFVQITNAITFEAWIKRGPKSSVQGIISLGYTALRMNLDKLQVYSQHEGSLNFYTTISLNDSPEVGEWTHVVSTYDATAGDDKWHIYVNGVEASSYDAQPDTGGAFLKLPTGSNAVMIGNRKDYDTSFFGIIDEPRIYNIALTAAEVNARYFWMKPAGTILIIE